eukprot:1363060-Pleurochrysis_carterae.AAC.1
MPLLGLEIATWLMGLAAAMPVSDGAGDGDVADRADNAVDNAICNSSLPFATSYTNSAVSDLALHFLPLMYGIVR